MRDAAWHLDLFEQPGLDPFFTALGWDVGNKVSFAEAYKDVIHEDAIRVGGAVKAPDDCFRRGGLTEADIKCIEACRQ